MSAPSSAAISEGLNRAGWTIPELWRASLAIGGRFTPTAIAAIVTGRHDATPIEHDILAATLNDHFVGHGQNHPVRYWRDLPPTTMTTL